MGQSHPFLKMPIQARTEFAAALNQIASEKGVDTQVVIEAIESAALAAYRKDLSLRGEEVPEESEDLKAAIDPVTGEVSIFRGQENITPPGFARIAAQTAKQVIMQKLYEAEKTAVMDEYEKKVGTVISCSLSRQEGPNWFVDLGRAEGLMPPSEQTRDEYYHQSQRLKVLIKEIREGRRGPEVVVSRADPSLVKGLFGLEVPEIQAGTVQIKVVAREAGGRCKIAAISTQEGVDPVGSLVGQRGVRVQAVMQELGDEKIDIISYSEDPARFIASALSPAKDVQVTLPADEERVAKVKVPDSQLSLAIGKGGQNVRLAAKLTGYKIDIEGLGDGMVRERGEARSAKVKEEGTAEKKEDTAAVPAGDSNQQDDSGAARKKVEEVVEENTEGEAAKVGTELPSEPGPKEAAPAAAQAEDDMQSEKDDSQNKD